jgi:hypothetical protein
MAPKKVPQNSKQAAGNARKAEQEQLKQQQKAQQTEAQVAQEWQQGADQRSMARTEAAAIKEAEAAKKRAEKAKLLEEEETSSSSIKVKKAASGTKKKAKNDLGLLDGFVTEAEKKAKAKKEADAKKKELLRIEQEEKQAAKEAARLAMDPLFVNTEAMLADAAGRAMNQLTMTELATSGMDGALDQLGGGGSSEVKSQKALYLAYEERTLPVVKADYPGLRLTQYKEKVFAMWKKSPENPQNALAVEKK